MDFQDLDEVIREFFPQQEQNSNPDNRADDEETIFPELIESDEEFIIRLASNFSQDHEDELQGCAGLNTQCTVNAFTSPERSRQCMGIVHLAVCHAQTVWLMSITHLTLPNS